MYDRKKTIIFIDGNESKQGSFPLEAEIKEWLLTAVQPASPRPLQ